MVYIFDAVYRQSIDVNNRISPGHLFLLTLKSIITHKPSRNRILHGHTRIVYHPNDTKHDISFLFLGFKIYLKFLASAFHFAPPDVR